MMAVNIIFVMGNIHVQKDVLIVVHFVEMQLAMMDIIEHYIEIKINIYLQVQIQVNKLKYVQVNQMKLM